MLHLALKIIDNLYFSLVFQWEEFEEGKRKAEEKQSKLANNDQATKEDNTTNMVSE